MMNLFILNFRNDYRKLKKFIKRDDIVYLTDLSLVSTIPKDLKYYIYTDFIEPEDISKMEEKHLYTYQRLVSSFSKLFNYKGIDLFDIFKVQFYWNQLIPIILDMLIIEKLDKKFDIKKTFFCGFNDRELVNLEASDILDISTHQNRFGLLYYLKNRDIKDFMILKPHAIVGVKYYTVKYFIPTVIDLIRRFNTLRLKKRALPEVQKDVLFILRTSNHLKFFFPIYDYIKQKIIEKEVICDFTVFNSTLLKALNNKKIDYLLLNNFMTNSVRREIKVGLSWLKRQIKESNIEKQIYKINEKDFTLAFRYVINEIVIKRWLKKAIIYIELANEMMRKLNPKVCIIFNEYTIIGAVVQRVCRLKGVKTLGIQHGALGTKCDFHSIEVDRFAVWGNLSKEKLINAGIPEDRIVVTGSAAYTEPIQTDMDADRKKGLTKFFGFEKDKPIILLTLNAVTFTPAFLTLKGVLEAANRLKAYNFLIKLHPGQSVKIIDDVLKYIEYDKKQVKITKDVDIKDTFMISDLVLTTISTTGAEAMIFKKPVIIVNFVKDIDREQYISMKAAVEIFAVEELIIEIDKIMKDKEYRESLINAGQNFVNQYFTEFSSRNVERIYNQIKALMP